MPKKSERVEATAEEPTEVLEEEEITPDSEPTEEPSEKPIAPTLKETPEFKEALREAQSGWDRKIASLKAEVNQVKTEAQDAKERYDNAVADLQALQTEHEDAMDRFLSDDPDAKRAYLDKKTIDETRKQVKIEKREAEQKLYEAEKLVWAINMAKKANELAKETGIPFEDLEDCQTEEAMEVKALRYQRKQQVEQPKLPTPAPKKVDSGISTGKGGKLSVAEAESMSVDDYAEHPSVKQRYK